MIQTLWIKAGLAHLWFVTLHPFDDGNGRLARAITDLSLARRRTPPALLQPVRADPTGAKVYYHILRATQKGDLDITPWLEWFLACLDRAFDRSGDNSGNCPCTRHDFWKQHAAMPPSMSASAICSTDLLDGFEGKLNTMEMGENREVFARTRRCGTSTISLSRRFW